MRSRIPIQILAVFFFLLTLLGNTFPVAAADDYASPIYLPLVSGHTTSQDNDNPTGQMPSINTFIQSVTNGQANTLRGAYVPEVFAYTIVQQPAGSSSYISSLPDVLTQFYSAAQFGVTGLLAHNNLAGEKFSGLAQEQYVTLIFGDGSTKTYQISLIESYQTLEPNNPYSALVNLDTQENLSFSQVFARYYMGDDHVTFQTCIARDGLDSWGRLFVVAYPIQ